MTDPVNTDALRTWAAARADAKLLPMIRAAADEVDRLRAELAESNAERSHFAAARESLIDEAMRLRAEADEVYRAAYRLGQQHSGAEVHKQRAAELRAVIENAPHDRDADCGFGCAPQDMSSCTCWKADAL
jgi:hypothetical protein